MSITSIEKTMIRRIDRRFQITARGGRLDAMLPVFEHKNDGQMIRQTVSRNLIILKVGARYNAKTFSRVVKKKHYWKKWRAEETNVRYFAGRNFHELVKELKAEFEK